MPASARSLLYHASGLLAGWAWFVLLVTGWSLTAGLLITFVGVGVLWLLSNLVRGGARVEAYLAASLLGARVGVPAPIPGLAVRARLTDQRFWRVQGFAAARLLVGFPVALLVWVLVADGLGLLAAPLWYWSLPSGIELGLLDVDTLPLAFAVIPLGAAMVALGVWLSGLTADPMRRLAEWGLPVTAPEAARTGARASRGDVAPLDWQPVLRATVAVAAVTEAVVIVVWAATGRTSDWWAWPVVGLLVPVGIALVGASKDRVPAGRRRTLAVHAGLAGVAAVVCWAAWIVAGNDAVWPVWPTLGLALSVGLHALLPQAALRERLEKVEASRADVVDARDDELRRIERDLHDGAQARLVALSMGLGQAEERLDADPERARELVLEAQGHARAAIKELRDLARGIAPPVLADRGLLAAVQALAGTSRLAVAVSGDAGTPRPPLPVERTAYFVVAEALANAAKHAGTGAAVTVALHRFPRSLEVEVADDGPGGAVVGAGSGLTGLVARVQALDGTLRVDSPAARGTTVHASLPVRG